MVLISVNYVLVDLKEILRWYGIHIVTVLIYIFAGELGLTHIENYFLPTLNTLCTCS